MFWQRKNTSIEYLLQTLEQLVRDDRAMFLEFGEEYFTLEELERMHEDWEREFNTTDRLRGRFVILCTSSLMLIPIAGMFVILGYVKLLPILFVSFPIFILIGLGGFLSLYFKYGRVAYQESVGRRLKFAIRNKRKRQGQSKER